MRTAFCVARILIAAWTMAAGLTATALSADPPAKKQPSLRDIFGQAGDAGPFQTAAPKVSAALKPAKAKTGETVTLSVTIDLPPGSHTYPQKKSSDIGVPTKITVNSAAGLQAVDKEFRPTTSPKTSTDPQTGEKQIYFEGSVTWTRRYRVSDAAKLGPVRGTIKFQVCTDTACLPPQTEKFTASGRSSAASSAGRTESRGQRSEHRGQRTEVRGQQTNPQSPPLTNAAHQPLNVLPAGATSVVESAKPQAARSAYSEGKAKSGGVHPFSAESTPMQFGKPQPIHLRFELSPSGAKPGEAVTAAITAKLDKGWHAFALTHKKGGIGLPVEIRVHQVQGLEPAGKGWRPHKPPTIETDDEGKQLLEHFGTVMWKRQFKVADGAKPGQYGLSGSFKYQICNAQGCKPPKTVKFSLGELTAAVEAPQGSNAIDRTPFPGGASDAQEGGLAWFLLAAFLGGLILNVMPCVLPVIAIKVMSFVQQGGEHRSRVIALNVVYSLGVIAVFLLLGSLAAGIAFSQEKIGWGGLFQKPEFNLIMACVIFTMGLALLGVFEIPLPGFIGSAAGGRQQEGLGGAFLTGVFATLLATPCTGPFMGPTFAWSLRQPPAVTLLVFGTMGLGMASPYVVFGFFPQAIRFLPKPGQWMLRFKQFAGFALMGTVVFFISFLPGGYVVPLLVMLMGIALGLWMIGNMYDMTSPVKHKRTVRVVALVLAVGICGFGYSMTMQSEHELPWQKFSSESLQASLNRDKTVLVDFTADWCLICKQNEKLALNRAETLEFVKDHGVVPLLADYTDQSPEIREWLERFETDGVPLTVIFPANRPDKPIVLRGPYLKSTLLEKLAEAVNMPKAEPAPSAGREQASLK